MIGLDWLRMFSSRELSTLVAGAEHEINVSDLQVFISKTNIFKSYLVVQTIYTLNSFQQLFVKFMENVLNFQFLMKYDV